MYVYKYMVWIVDANMKNLNAATPVVVEKMITLLWFYKYWAIYFTKNVLSLPIIPVRIYSFCELWSMMSIICCSSSKNTMFLISISNTWSLCFGAHLEFILEWSNNGIKTWMSCRMCSRFKYEWSFKRFLRRCNCFFVFMRLQYAYSNKYS